MAFLLPVNGNSKSKENIRKGETDLHVNIEDDSPVHVNAKILDLFAKSTEAIVTKKTNEQKLKVSQFSVYVKVKLNRLDKQRRSIIEYVMFYLM